MKVIRYSGLAIFLLGLTLLLTAPLITKYKVTDETLSKLSEYNKIDEIFSDPAKHFMVNENLRHDVFGELAGLKDQKFSSSLSFQSEVKSKLLAVKAIQKENFEQAKASGKIPGDAQEWQFVLQDYKITDFQFWIGRYSIESFLYQNVGIGFLVTFGLMILGGLMFILPGIKLDGPAGIKNNKVFFQSFTKQGGLIAILIGTALILMYITLYWFPQFMSPYAALADPVSFLISGSPASYWFLYGLLYTIAVFVMGARMFVKYRHSNYQLVRTGSVFFFQLVFAFFLPDFMASLNYQPYYDFKVAWPLDYDFFYSDNMNKYHESSYGMLVFAWGILLAFLIVPLVTYFIGKRWYCSWVCGCGGLAETFADPWRQQSSKTLKSWKIERVLIHSVLVFVFLTTIATILNYYTGILGFLMYPLQDWYKFLITMIFAGIVGTGFYPLMGNRLWCRFGCPLAAILGYVQRFKSRFRITTNGGQCISCGNCSTYCEMGIDVKWYAQRGQDIVRSSCVGCGVCSAVCPRGVLNLENGPVSTRNFEPQTVSGISHP